MRGWFQLVVQALLNLGMMLISAVGARRPSSYREIADVLEEIGALDRGQARLLRLMADMRNILVHAYTRVDRDLVLRASKSLITDAPMIAERILRKADEMVRDPDDFEGVSIPLEDVLNKLREILKGRVKAAFLFGGRAKGYVLRGDIDIAVFLRPPL